MTLYQFDGYYCLDIETGKFYWIVDINLKDLQLVKSIRKWLPCSKKTQDLLIQIEKGLIETYTWVLDTDKHSWIDLTTEFPPLPDCYIPNRYWKQVYTTYMMNQL